MVVVDGEVVVRGAQRGVPVEVPEWALSRLSSRWEHVELTSAIEPETEQDTQQDSDVDASASHNEDEKEQDQ